MESNVEREKCGKMVVKYITVLQWLPRYTKFHACSDFIAGITIGLTMIPQSIAYAALGGLPAQYGLYSSFLGGFIYLIFGTVKEVSIGPSSLMALLTLNYTRNMPVDFVILLTFLAGCVELTMGLLNLGFLVDFISIPVTSGFTSATSVIIIIAQLQGLVGLKYHSESILDNVIKFFQNLGNARLNDALLGIGSIAFLLCFRRLQYLNVLFIQNKRKQKLVKKIFWVLSISRNAFIVILCFFISTNIHTPEKNPFILSGQVQSGFPEIKPPSFTSKVGNSTYNFFDICSHLGSGIIVVPLIAVLANVAIAKAFASNSGVDASQEMRTLGICNILGSFVSSMPTAGAFTRSAVSSASGVQTPMAGLFTGILAMLALSYLTPYFYFIPRATLSAVLISAVLFLIDFKVVYVLWKGNRIDAISFVTTFTTCLLLSIEIGLLIGIALNVSHLLYLTARPTIKLSQFETTFGEEYIVATPDTGLFYPAVDFVTNELYKVIKKPLHKNMPLVVDCSKFKGVDYTAVKGIERLVKKFEENEGKIFFVNVNSSLVRQIHELSLTNMINIIHSTDNLTEQLMNKAKPDHRSTTMPFLSDLNEMLDVNEEDKTVDIPLQTTSSENTMSLITNR